MTRYRICWHERGNCALINYSDWFNHSLEYKVDRLNLRDKTHVYWQEVEA